MSIVEPNRTTDFIYDASGNVQSRTVTDTSVSPNVARTQSYTYNGFGQVLTIDGPRTDVSDVTTIAYYTCTSGSSCGQVHTVTNAAGQVTTFNTYNVYGEPLTVTDPNGVLITLSYDTEGRLTSRQVGSETTSFSYYPIGLLKNVTQPDGTTLTRTYNPAHQLTVISDAAGNSLSLTPDALGNITATQTYDASNALHYAHSRVFNTLSQPYQDVGAAGGSGVTTTYGYDSNGNVTSIAAPLGRNTGFTPYDALNRLTQITDPLSGVTHITYDADDHVQTVQDPQGLTTTYNHNGFGEVSSLVSPQAGTTSNTYDSGGNLSTSTDARGALATYGYDALNRLTSASYQAGGVTDQTIVYTYDANTNGKAHLTGASDANHALAWSYDAQGRVIGRGQTVGGTTLGVGYGYSGGNLTALTTPSNQIITYTYSNHQISGITVGSTTLLSGVTYEPFGAVSGWSWGNGTSEMRSHTADGNLNQVGGPEVVTLGYDNAFRITSASNAANSALSWSYNGYDNLDRLTSATQSGTSMGWGYTADGDRQNQTGASTPSPLWTSSPTFTYNDRGRMSTATTATASTTYIYDALGELIQKTNTLTTLLAYDEAGHLIGEYTSTGALIQETVWLGDIPVATLRPNGSSISVYYIHADQLGAPRLITRPSDNAFMWRWDADPYGTTGPNQNPQGAGTFVYNLRFPGQYYQSETGLNYNYFRDYDPQTGRYLESDPIGLAGGNYSTYGYAGANPISYYDSLGLDIMVITGGVRTGDNHFNPFGHVGSAVQGYGMASYGNDTPLGSSVLDYLNSQSALRAQQVTIIPTSPVQDLLAQAFIKKHPNMNDVTKVDNCAVRTNQLLNAAGVDVSGNMFPGGVAREVASLPGATTYFIPQNGSIPQPLLDVLSSYAPHHP